MGLRRFDANMPGQEVLMLHPRQLREIAQRESFDKLLQECGVEDPVYAAPHLQQAVDFLNEESGTYGKQAHVRAMSNDEFKAVINNKYKLKEQVIDEIEQDRVAVEIQAKWSFARAVKMLEQQAEVQSDDERKTIELTTAAQYEKFHDRFSRGQGRRARLDFATYLRKYWLKY